MAVFKPATPGFLVTLVATILLAVVSFSVPWFKSVFFLKASLAVEGVNGSVTFGTLGYCLELSNGTTCSKPSVGYELDVNKLLGNKLPVDIPQVAVKWLTYALVLHIVALILAAGSAVFGLLAHVREMSMACCSTCVSGFAAAVALLAFIFDLAFFFIAKARINKVKGGHADMGNAIWLTLAAWILLFFSGCFYTLGRCCIRRRPRSSKDRDRDDTGPAAGGVSYADQMRLDAVKAEADRKARAKRGEGGLPAFNEYDDSAPLKAHVDGDHVYDEEHAAPYRDNSAHSGYAGRQPSQNTYAGGYAQAPVGSRAVDEYYNPSQTNYPPQPQRQGSQHTQSVSGYAPSTYQQSNYTSSAYNYGAAAVPPVPNQNSHNQYLGAPGQGYGSDQYGATAGQDYGHVARGTSYHSAVEHQQQPSQQQYNDPYNAYASHTAQPTVEAYNTAPFASPPTTHSPPIPTPSPHNFYGAAATPATPERSYTLGGGGYGSNTVPAPTHSPELPFPGETHITSSPAPIDTGVSAAAGARSPGSTSPVKGPRAQRASVQYDDAPPGYDQPGHSGSGHAW